MTGEPRRSASQKIEKGQFFPMDVEARPLSTPPTPGGACSSDVPCRAILSHAVRSPRFGRARMVSPELSTAKTSSNPAAGPSPEALATLRSAHLQMIQGIIGRMSATSATLKGFCITTTAAILALKGDELGVRVFWLLVLVALFAMCDAGYLRMERDFRRLYGTVAKRPLSAAEDMAIERPNGHASGYVGAVVSWSVAAFYISIAAAVVFIGVLAGK